VRERERERERERTREERELFKEFKEFSICAVNASLKKKFYFIQGLRPYSPLLNSLNINM